MTLIFAMLTVQVLLGGFDNLWHHEITEKLPSNPSARFELSLHAAREFLYAVIFTSIAWFRWEGLFTYLLVGLLATEIAVTLTDFVVEDRTRRLPAFERILHTVLAINFGAIFALWAPELFAWSKQPTALAAADYGMWSYLFTAFGAGVFVWSLRDLYASVALGVPSWQRHPLKRAQVPYPRTILVTGATGFIGRELVQALLAKGDSVIALSRNLIKARDVLGPHVELVASLDAIAKDTHIDAIVNLAGEPVMGGPWTKRRKRVIVESRLGVTATLEVLVQRLEKKPEILVSGSAIGYYGSRGDALLTERSGGQDMFMSYLCDQWENAANRLSSFGLRVCTLRIGLVLGRDGGILPSMSLPMHFGMSAQFGRGRQFMSWIHLDDLVRLILFACENTAMSGAVNATAPNPVTHRDFMRRLERPFGWQIRLPVPASALKLALGELSILFLGSQRVVPALALAHGFQFRFEELDDALTDLLRTEPGGTAMPAAYLNEACPACATELNHYRKLAATSGANVEICEIGAKGHELAAFGLDSDDLRRRLYAVRSDGSLCSGVDAFIAIWRELPSYRPLARLVALPGFYHLADFVYEGIIVPVLSAWNRRRNARALKPVRTPRTPQPRSSHEKGRYGAGEVRS